MKVQNRTNKKSLSPTVSTQAAPSASGVIVRLIMKSRRGLQVL